MELPKIVQELPKAPADVRDWILKDVVKGRYIIYSTKENKAVCTYCGHVYRITDAELIPLPSRGEKVICPQCKSEAEYKCKGLGRKNLTELTRVMVVVSRGKSLYVSIAEVDISFEKEMPEVLMWMQAVYKFNKKEQLYYKHSPGWCYGGECWKKMRKIKIPGIGGMGYFPPKRCGVHVYSKNLATVHKKTDLKYADLQSFWESSSHNEDMLLEYIYLSAKYESIELLWKSGFQHLVRARASGGDPRNSIYLRGTDLRKILGLQMDHIRKIRQAELSFLELSVYKKQLKKRDPVTPDHARLIANFTIYLDKEHLDKIEKYTTIKKVAFYLSAQNKKRKKIQSTMRDYYDYLGECEKLQRNLVNKQVLFPKNFVRAHDEAGKEIRLIRDKVDMEAFIRNQKAITKMDTYYSNDGLLIRPAESPEEMRLEGNALHHCVGGYSQGVVEGKRAVLLIRKESKPNVPFYTLELSPKGKVIQCRGKYNCSATKEIDAFVEKWLLEVVNKKTAKKRGKVA